MDKIKKEPKSCTDIVKEWTDEDIEDVLNYAEEELQEYFLDEPQYDKPF